ncbi:MAG: 2'-5' RNA ligase family protein [Lachnospiraceae bacterium]|nr:2'-5' RNA ligase family protein [Lachnospiraceae bacterium]
MYIWIGIDVDEQVENIREKVREQEILRGIVKSNLTLPFHISLKMSFPMEEERAAAVMDAAEAYLRTFRPFDIPVAGIEYHTTIAWIRMRENPVLDRIHDGLDAMLAERFGVGQHEYDKDYLFHTTLFMEDDAGRVRQGYEAVKDEPLPAVLTADTFLIGASETGALGSYRVIRRIRVS